jgi:uncharacterized membrane protein YqgA involved in biofilm formation
MSALRQCPVTLACEDLGSSMAAATEGYRRHEIGTLLNTATVIVGALLGRAVGSRFPERLRETAIDGIGLLVLLIGAEMALGTRHVLYVMGAVLIGGLLGEGLRIEDHLEAFGDWLERRVGVDDAGEGSDFSRGFVTTSILFCVGPVTLMGCIQDGLHGDYNLLAVKSVLDGISALAFASALGWGVLFSAGTVLVVQGALTLGARTLSGVLTPAMDAELFATGGVILLGLGIRLLGLKPVRVANFLPGLVVAPLLVSVVPLVAAALQAIRK